MPVFIIGPVPDVAGRTCAYLLHCWISSANFHCLLPLVNPDKTGFLRFP